MKTLMKVATLISMITAIPVISVNTVINPIITYAKTNQLESEKTVTLHTSWNKSDNSDIQYSVIVYSDNSIYVKCQSLGKRYTDSTNFGTISFNDDIFNSDISLNKNNNRSLESVDNYKDLNEIEYIEYTFIYYHDYTSYYFSDLIFEFTLSPLTEITEQTTVNLFGKEIVLNKNEPAQLKEVKDQTTNFHFLLFLVCLGAIIFNMFWSSINDFISTLDIKW